MEFDEMKKIWDVQTQSPLYIIDEKAMHNRILSKKKQSYHITNASELLLIIVNAGAGTLILGMNLFQSSVNIVMYLMAAWMFGSAVYSLVSRIRRIKNSTHFERTMLGDLNQAIAVATYQVNLSQIMRWNILPLGLFSVLGLWEGGKSIWLAVGIVILFAVAHRFSGWEHNFYKSRKRELEILKNKLENG